MLSLQWIVFVKFITKSDKGTLTAPSPRHWVRLGQPLVVILRKTWAAPLIFKPEERLLRAAFKKKKNVQQIFFSFSKQLRSFLKGGQPYFILLSSFTTSVHFHLKRNIAKKSRRGRMSSCTNLEKKMW